MSTPHPSQQDKKPLVPTWFIWMALGFFAVVWLWFGSTTPDPKTALAGVQSTPVTDMTGTMTPIPEPPASTTPSELPAVTVTATATVTVAAKASPAPKPPKPSPTKSEPAPVKKVTTQKAPVTTTPKKSNITIAREGWCGEFNRRLVTYNSFGKFDKRRVLTSDWAEETWIRLNALFKQYLKAGGKPEAEVTRITPLDGLFSEDTMLNCKT